MAVIHDIIPNFALFQPDSLEGAMNLLAEHGEDAWPLAGGLDSFDWFKDRTKRPKVVIDLGGIAELHGIRAIDDGIEIGALTSLTDVERNAEIMENYSLLSQAAGNVASPQIRNQGTIGGNVSQDTRCWYYRGGWPCYRAGGNICYADTPTSMNREHCIVGASRCVAVNPSDTAPALIALDAKMVIRSGGSERVVSAEDFFIGPAVDITRMTVMKPTDLLTAIRLPAEWAGQTFYFEKVADRKAWDFPLVNVASAIKLDGDKVSDVRIAVNGVAPYPVRLKSAEAKVRGKAANEETGQAAGEVAVRGTKPLAMNGYKVALMRNLVKRAVRGTVA